MLFFTVLRGFFLYLSLTVPAGTSRDHVLHFTEYFSVFILLCPYYLYFVLNVYPFFNIFIFFLLSAPLHLPYNFYTAYAVPEN